MNVVFRRDFLQYCRIGPWGFLLNEAFMDGRLVLELLGTPSIGGEETYPGLRARARSCRGCGAVRAPGRLREPPPKNRLGRSGPRGFPRRSCRRARRAP